MYIDIFIVVLLLWAAYNGWRHGFTKEIIMTVGWIAGLLVAMTFYSTLGEYLTVDGSETNMLTSIGAFLILWIITPIALGFVADRFSSFLDLLHWGFINRSGGVVVSIVKYMLLVSCVFNMMDLLGIMNPQRKQSSLLYEPVSSLCGIAFTHVVRPAMNIDNLKGLDTIWVSMKPDTASKTVPDSGDFFRATQSEGRR